jgi:hypothetical protein
MGNFRDLEVITSRLNISRWGSSVLWEIVSGVQKHQIEKAKTMAKTKLAPKKPR